MTVVDVELRKREHEQLLAELNHAGVFVADVDELREPAKQTSESLCVLLKVLPHLREAALIAHSVVVAIGCHRCGTPESEALANYFHELGTISFDEYIQVWNSRILQNQSPLSNAKARQQAEKDICHAWYLSYEPPLRTSVRAYDADFPDARTLSAYHDAQVKMALGNVFKWQARRELFQIVEGMLRGTPHSAGRELLPEALVKCDASRATDSLMPLLNDAGVGAHAMVELGKLRYAPARPHIEQFLDHPIDWVRREAKKALRRLDQAAGSRAATAAPFDEVLPASERARGAKLVAGTGAKPRDIEGKVSAFVIGALAEEERGWTRDHCVATSVELEELDRTFRLLGRALHGDFSGKRGKLLREEIMAADHEDWKAYKLRVQVGGQDEEIWFHYFLNDVTTVDLAIWGPTAVIAAAKGALSRE